jgi:DNA-directed RNA polymerase specialized sigma24 family protein
MLPTIGAAEFEELFGATVRDVLAYVRRRTTGDAEDLVAEVYAVAWRRRADLPAPMLRRPFLFGIARTLIKAEGRLLRRESDLVGELGNRPVHSTTPIGAERTAVVMAAALERRRRPIGRSSDSPPGRVSTRSSSR